MSREPKRTPATPAPAGQSAVRRLRPHSSRHLVAIGLVGTGLYATGLAAAADAQAPTPAPTAEAPDPTPISSVTPAPTPEATVDPVPTPEATVEPTPTPKPTGDPVPTASPEATADPVPTPTPEATASPVPTPTPEALPSPTPKRALAPARATDAARSTRARAEAGSDRRETNGTRPSADRQPPSEHMSAAPPGAELPMGPPSGDLAQDFRLATLSMSVPVGITSQFRVPLFLLPVYQSAADRYGVPWEILAAINELETDYGRNARVSSAGAVGWMQFLPSTWKTYGVDASGDGVKDPSNPIDAIFAAARYLRAAGADRDLQRAVFAYNHAEWYVDAVLRRAQSIRGVPQGLIASLTALGHGRFPVAARATYDGSLIFAHAGTAVVAANDGRIVSVGRSKHLGRFVTLRDASGTTYTYARLKRVGTRRTTGGATKVRLYAHRDRDRGIRFTRLRPGTRVVAGTILGRIGHTQSTRRPHVLFRIRPSGHRAPQISPEPILDGWRLLAAAGTLPAGRARLSGLNAKELAARVLANPQVDVYDCGRGDIRAGEIDRRVLATLELLAASGLNPTVSSLRCGHSLMTRSGNVSEHSTGTAVDISAINAIPIAGHQGPGSITEVAVRRLLALDGVMRPHQIITLMPFEGASNTFGMPDHADHIHIGWRPLTGRAENVAGEAGGFDAEPVLSRAQWRSLVRRWSQLPPAMP